MIYFQLISRIFTLWTNFLKKRPMEYFETHSIIIWKGFPKRFDHWFEWPFCFRIQTLKTDREKSWLDFNRLIRRPRIDWRLWIKSQKWNKWKWNWNVEKFGFVSRFSLDLLEIESMTLGSCLYLLGNREWVLNIKFEFSISTSSVLK
jgi:hypothetical protein